MMAEQPVYIFFSQAGKTMIFILIASRSTHALPNSEKSLAYSKLLNDVYQKGFRSIRSVTEKIGDIHCIPALNHWLESWKEDSGDM